jgi:hypothetical protein
MGWEMSDLELLHEAHHIEGQLHRHEKLSLVEATLEHAPHGNVVNTHQMVALAHQIESTRDNAARADDRLVVDKVRHLAALPSESSEGRGRGGERVESYRLRHSTHEGLPRPMLSTMRATEAVSIISASIPVRIRWLSGRKDEGGGRGGEGTNLPTSSVCL